MKKYTTLLLFLASALTLRSQNFVNGQAARAVFGQYTFTLSGATPGTTATIPGQQILGGVSGIAWANGTLYVVDSNPVGNIPQDNRVVMFNTNQVPGLRADLTNTQSFSTFSCNVCGFPAFNQLGQPGFGALYPVSTDNPDSFPIGLNNDPAQSNMRRPNGVATDGNILAVADTDNNRVLIWNSIPTTINQAANVVLGQTSFTTGGAASPPTASSLSGPQGVWIQNGKLFVADTQNYRVLIWNNIPTSNNQAADVVLGQGGFTSGTQAACDPTTSTITSGANELCNPVSVTSDGTHLFVSDIGFNRVLIWNSIPTSNGQNADVVIGQPNMTSAVANNPAVCITGTGQNVACEANLNFPRYALSDGTRLFVADGGNDRVLIFNTIPTQNAAVADEVLGQPDFKTNNVSSQDITITSTAIDTTSAVDVVPTPMALAFDGTNLYVSDSVDNRVVVFTPGDTPLPDKSVVNWASEIIRQEGVITLGPATAGTSPVSGDTITVTLGSATYTYTIKTNDTFDAVAQGLVSAINANSGDPNAIAFFAGTNTAALYVSSKGTDLAFDAIAFSVTSSNTANEVATASGNGYLTAGNAGTGSPGMLVEINGTNLSDLPPTNPAVATLTGFIPTSLGGAQVFMDGIATPIYSASSNQIVTQVPYNSAGRNSTSVFVRTTHGDGSVTVTNSTPIYIAPANPGIFDAPSSPGESRPWPAKAVYHQPGNPEAVVDITGSVNAGDVLTITTGGNAHSYTVQSADTLATIVTGLINSINNANDPGVTATYGAAFNRVVVVARQSGAAGNGITVAASAASGAKVTLTAYTDQTCCNVVAGSAITANNPAVPGETITVSAAGLGQVEDLSGNVVSNVSTGGPYTGYPINSATNPVNATMGSNTAQVVGAGLTQGSYGVYQVQLIVPENQPTDAVTSVYIAQNAFISNTVTIPVGPANSNPDVPPVGSSDITISIDQPNPSSSALSGGAPVAGWAIGQSSTISSVQVSVDGVAVGSAVYGGSRADVCATHGSSASCANGNTNVGYNYALDTTQFADGTHTLQITATDGAGVRFTQGGSFQSSNFSGSTASAIGIDAPSAQGDSYQGSAHFSGWALNTTAAIASVSVSIDGISHGSVTYGGSRPDVCAVYTSAVGCPNVGWSYLLDTTTLANGKHNFAVTSITTDGQRFTQAHPFNVANWTTANPLLVSIDQPTPQTPALSGLTNVAGWAISPTSQIATVSIAIDGVPYGNAGYGAPRPDVCAIYSNNPGCPNVGWNFSLDTTSLGDGIHNLEVTVLPVSGQGYTNTVQFRVANQGISTNSTLTAIDSPNASTAPFSGYAAFGGWGLNTASSVNSVAVSIDGVFSGYAVYGGARADVCAKFPSSSNCPGVGWNYYFDTTSLTNGSHSVEVTTTSANGQRASSNSTFTVSNSAGPSPTSVAILQPSSQSTGYQGLASFSGTAISTSSTVSAITVTIDGYPYGSANFTAAAANQPVNWSYPINSVQFADGTHIFGVTATAADGTSSVTSSTFVVANWTSPSPTRISIDIPNSSSPSFKGVAGFGGWAFNSNAAITAVTVTIDGVAYGSAQYGGDRSDVCANYPGQPGCPNVGWNFAFDTTYLTNGTHTVAITATTAAGQSSTMSSSFIVAN